MFSRFLPKSHKFYAGVAKFGLEKVRKSTGADIIGFVPREGGNLDLAPMKAKRVGDEATRMVWKTIETNEEWEMGPEGLSHEYVGKTPVGFFVSDPHREVSLFEARIRDAIDFGQVQGIYPNANVELHEHIQIPESPEELDGGGEAVADGGAQAQGNVIDRNFQVDINDLPRDYVIDTTSNEHAAGSRVSWRRVNDILYEQSTTEEMEMQEKRGELAGAAGNEDKVTRIAIYALIAIVAVVGIFFLGPSIVNGIFGGGSFLGGAGGGGLPVIGGG